jgi:hypothetical protein
MVPLGISGYRAGTTESLRRKGYNAITEWIGGTDYDVVSVKSDGTSVEAVIAGEGELPEFDSLLSDLRKTAGEVQVDLQVVPERTLSGKTGS